MSTEVNVQMAGGQVMTMTGSSGVSLQLEAMGIADSKRLSQTDDIVPTVYQTPQESRITERAIEEANSEKDVVTMGREVVDIEYVTWWFEVEELKGLTKVIYACNSSGTRARFSHFDEGLSHVSGFNRFRLIMGKHRGPIPDTTRGKKEEKNMALFRAAMESHRESCDKK